jgi:hypothetical protein
MSNGLVRTAAHSIPPLRSAVNVLIKLCDRSQNRRLPGGTAGWRGLPQGRKPRQGESLGSVPCVGAETVRTPSMSLRTPTRSLPQRAWTCSQSNLCCPQLRLSHRPPGRCRYWCDHQCRHQYLPDHGSKCHQISHFGSYDTRIIDNDITAVMAVAYRVD